MILLITLRILFILKWTLQASGIVISTALWPSAEEGWALPLLAVIFLILPEAVMWIALWISNGIAAIHARQHSKDDHVQKIPVFSERLLTASFYAYVLILTAIAAMLGCFLKISILSGAVAIFFCFYQFDKLNHFIKKYLDINI